MPDMPSTNRKDRRGGATQLTPRPGTNGRTNDRDNRRILRILVIAAVVLLVGWLIFNGFWWQRSP